jgi:hypothetical protein
VAEVGGAAQRRDRGRVQDHATASLLDHRPGRSLSDDERGGEVDGDHLEPGFVLHLEERLLRPGGGVRDGDVEPSGRLVGLSHGSVALLDRRELGDDRPDARTGRLELRGNGLQPFREPVDEEDLLGSFGGKAERGGAPEPAAAARDEHHLAVVPSRCDHRTAPLEKRFTWQPDLRVLPASRQGSQDVPRQVTPAAGRDLEA